MLECGFEPGNEAGHGGIPRQCITGRSNLLVGLIVSGKRRMFVQPLAITRNQIATERRHMRWKIPIDLRFNHQGGVKITESHLQKPRSTANLAEFYRVIIPARYLFQPCQAFGDQIGILDRNRKWFRRHDSPRMRREVERLPCKIRHVTERRIPVKFQETSSGQPVRLLFELRHAGEHYERLIVSKLQMQSARRPRIPFFGA